MSRRARHDWHFSGGRSPDRRTSTRPSAVGLFPYRRRLRFEPLEDRRLLANVTVSNLNDLVNGTTTSIAALVASNGGGVSLQTSRPDVWGRWHGVAGHRGAILVPHRGGDDHAGDVVSSSKQAEAAIPASVTRF